MRAINQLMRGIKQPKGGNFAAMPYADVPAFMAKLRDGDASVGRLALQFLILTAARSGEVRGATWREFNLDKAEWRIPPERMKADKLHIVPLGPAAVTILEEMRGLFAPKAGDLVFPGLKGQMSDATMAKALRVAGAGEYTVHGFRSSFRDWAADTGFADAWAEAALAHSNPNKTEAAYRRTTYFEQRRDKLMPAWASFVWLALSKRSGDADAALFDYAWHGSQSRSSGDHPGDPPDWRRFQEATDHLDWLAVFLRRAGMRLEVNGPNWRLADRREQRVFRAQCLSVVFARAFDLEPTVNTWETAKTRGPWPDFYQRVVRLAFGENVTPNLETVLDEARRRDLDHRVSFASGIIPDEPL
jgi:hypothetical protein